MRKSEFLQELKEALQGEVSGGVLQENLRYYDNYITQETAAGRREAAIMRIREAAMGSRRPEAAEASVISI